jgi:hypothetical protein
VEGKYIDNSLTAITHVFECWLSWKSKKTGFMTTIADLLPALDVDHWLAQVALEIGRKALLAVHVDPVDVCCSAKDALVLFPQAGQDALAVEDVSALQLKWRPVLETDAAVIAEFGVVHILEVPFWLELYSLHLFGVVLELAVHLHFDLRPSETSAAEHKDAAVPDALQGVV